MDISNVYFGEAALTEILKGVDILSNAVKTTMGPSGGTVIIDRPGKPPHLTKDGVTVAKAIILKNRLENIGASIIKEAAQRTAETAGDGTTTSTVIAQELAHQIIKMSRAGFDTRQMYRAIQDGVDVITDQLVEITQSAETQEALENIAKISANGEQVIADAVANGFGHVGVNGTVTVEEAKGFETTIDLVDGTELDRGYVSHYFSNTNNSLCTFENARILIVDESIKTLQQIIHFVSWSHDASEPLVIIANDFDNDAIQPLIVNKMKASLKICCIKAPEFGQARSKTLSDLSSLFGCTLVTNLDHIGDDKEDIQKFLGTVKKVTINRTKSLFVGSEGNKEEIKQIVSNVVRDLEDPTLSDSEKKFLYRRKARMSNGIAVIRVGGDTSAEVAERIDRVDDAIQATKAALTEGYVPGGGITLAKLSEECLKEKRTNTDSYNVGLRVLKSACHAPIRQILSHLPNSDSLISQAKRKDGDMTIDAIAGKIINSKEAGIIDPTKVVRLSIINATSAALNLLRVKCAAVIEDQAEDVDISEIFINDFV